MGRAFCSALSFSVHPVFHKAINPGGFGGKDGLDDSISAGLNMEQKGVEVIITRKATANILRERLNIPVLAIGVTAFDPLHSLKIACQKGTKILLHCLKEELPQIDISQNFFGLDIFVWEFYDVESLKKCVYSGALPDQLFESELFGHEEGAFTGSKKAVIWGFLNWPIMAQSFWMKLETLRQGLKINS